MDTKLDIPKIYLDLNKKKAKKIKSFDSGLCSLGIQSDIKKEITIKKKSIPTKEKLTK
jgi:hypothetical protein